MSRAACHHVGRQYHFLVGVQQGNLADLLQIHPHGIVDIEAVHQRIGIDQLFLFDLRDLLDGRLRILRQIVHKVVGVELDAQPIQRFVDLLHLLAFQIKLIQQIGQIARIQLVLFFALLKQILQSFVGLQQSGGRQSGDRGIVQFAALFFLCRFRGVMLRQKLIRHFLQLLFIQFLFHGVLLHIPSFF